ncbi:hypothetical protein CF326_g5879 [Tilletia indica]|nr:hypothetical protein CF326_g5879 [Tilletia indica]
MDEPLKVKLPTPLIGTPRMTLGPHYLKFSDKQTIDRLHMKDEMAKPIAVVRLHGDAGVQVDDHVKIGWIAHSKPPKSCSDLVSGKVRIEDIEKSGKRGLKTSTPLIDKK